MPNPYFKFKQFLIHQDKCAMKVNTDGVLLGAWINTEAAKNILDIGTGTGLIALMIAQKSLAMIDAIEIDKNAAAQALENAQQSPWSKRIAVHHISLQEYVKQTHANYDLIVSNPPYFVNAKLSAHNAQAIARHDSSLTFEELITHSSSLLTPQGKLCVILPVEESSLFNKHAEMQDLYLVRSLHIKTTPRQPVKRILMEYSRTRYSTIKDNLLIHDEKGAYSDAYISLTKAYYLDF